MIEPKKRNCEITEVSGEVDMNKGDAETYKSHKYKAAPKVFFNDAIAKALDKLEGKNK